MTVNTIIGLGNPGQTYHDTRHNVGFMVIELLAKRHSVPINQQMADLATGRPACVYGEYRDGTQTARLLMPLTMMNESGDALRAIQNPAAEVLVVCDDVNLPLGAVRLRPQGSAGGHHGLQSCLEALGTEQVARLRIGVGVTPLSRDLTDFVLSPFHSDERPLVKTALEQAADACELWVREGIDVAMNHYNRT